MSGYPRLATCSYTGFQRRMGYAVRITLYAPRWIHLPDERYTWHAKWPHLTELTPQRDYFKAEAPVFRERFLSQLDVHAADIDRKLGWLVKDAGGAQLVLLCFEKDVRDPDACHRRMFAAWWEARTGERVPELGGGR